MKRFVPFLVLPVLVLLLVTILPMALGRQTLYQRDVMNAHLPAKAAQAAAFADLELPWVDVLRGGQPLLGNPNTLTLYPDSLLLPLDPIWGLNAHFWIHWLLAPFAFAWLGRACGLSRPAAWAAGVLYATSGYFLALMNLCNLIPAATLTPALVAALLDSRGPARPWRFPAIGALWALLLLSGDPFSVLLAALLGATALWAAARRPDAATAPAGWWRRLIVALTLGSACAAPLWVEFVRILPFSFRAAISDQATASLTQSVPPASVIEWFWPLFFGPYDFSFWGSAIYDQGSSLLLSLFPGVLAWALLAAAGRPRGNPLARWAWVWLIAGLLLAFGRHDPLVAAAYQLPAVPALRFPIKFWLVVAIAAALLGGFGFERWLAGGRRTLPAMLALFAGLYLAAFLVLLFQPALFRSGLDALGSGLLPGPAFEAERPRLMWTALELCACAGLMALATGLRGRSPAMAAGALLVLHTFFQLQLLGSLIETDDAAFYRQPPPIAANIPPDALVIHGTLDAGMFGATPLAPRQRFPDLRQLWLSRCRHLELGHPTAALLGRPYDLAISPEGLDSYFSVLVHNRLEKAADDAERLRALAALGVEYLVLDRPLGPGARATRIAAIEGGCTDDSALYRVDDAAPAWRLVGGIRLAKSAREAYDLFAAPAFDPRAMVVLADDGHQSALDLPTGRVERVEERRDRLSVEVDSLAGGVFVTRRAYLPIYRAWIDGQPAEPLLVNAYRLGLLVPPGRHHLELAIDRRPTLTAFALALLGVAGLLRLGLANGSSTPAPPLPRGRGGWGVRSAFRSAWRWWAPAEKRHGG